MWEKIDREIQTIFPIGLKSLLIFILFGTIAAAGYAFYTENKDLEQLRYFSEIVDVNLIFYTALVLWMIRRINLRLNWFISATISKFQQLERTQTQAKESLISVKPSDSRWPWGTHHTEALGHLEAAATRYWSLYDPADSSTAPTNEMVADWLRSERGVTKERAQQIASILRADGLKAGPRR